MRASAIACAWCNLQGSSSLLPYKISSYFSALFNQSVVPSSQEWPLTTHLARLNGKGHKIKQTNKQSINQSIDKQKTNITDTPIHELALSLHHPFQTIEILFYILLTICLFHSQMTADALQAHGWDDKVAVQVPISYSHSTKNDNHSNFYLTYTYESNILKLNDSSSGRVVDRVNANDIIGVEIEFCLDENDNGECIRSSKKAFQGQEKMEALEKEIGKKMIDASQCDASAESEDAGIFSSFGGNGATAYLNIYAYPRALPRRGILQQLKECYTNGNDNGSHESLDDDETNIDPTLLGYRYGKHRRYKIQPTEDFAMASSLVKNIRNVAGLQPTNHRYLVIVNTFSGKKKGRETYENVVKKMLDESGIQHDVLITKRAGHAVERMMEQDKDAPTTDNTDFGGKDIAEYDGIIAMGGDGILAEVLKGLKTRSDYDEVVRKLKFGIVGCGTSNGLAASVLYAAKVSSTGTVPLIENQESKNHCKPHVLSW